VTKNYSYKGNWKDNMKHGTGEYIWKSEARYVGCYQFDKRHGYGEYFFPDKRMIRGEWINGVLDKDITSPTHTEGS
jgi:hypothetical protein